MSEEQASAGGNKRERRGVVLKNAMQKTVVVEVVRHVRHAMYGKAQKRRVRYKAHDENNTCSIGDQVLLEETRPTSKTKRWRVKQIVQRTAGV
jgi:small subunit ribosomal protein S17